jgi:hypothetical protein
MYVSQRTCHCSVSATAGGNVCMRHTIDANMQGFQLLHGAAVLLQAYLIHIETVTSRKQHAGRVTDSICRTYLDPLHVCS